MLSRVAGVDGVYLEDMADGSEEEEEDDEAAAAELERERARELPVYERRQKTSQSQIKQKH